MCAWSNIIRLSLYQCVTIIIAADTIQLEEFLFDSWEQYVYFL